MKAKYLIGAVVVVVFIVVAIYSLGPTTTMYATFAETRKHPGQSMQIYGKPDMKSIVHDEKAGSYSILVTDKEGDQLKIVADGAPPSSKMNDAENVVIRGEYKDGVFKANEILFKCPSKYQKKIK